jgi:structural maintenance of chromosome 1
LAELRATVDREVKTSESLQAKKQEIEEELKALRSEIDRQRRKLEEANNELDAATVVVDELKESARKTQRTLDKALKEIASWNDEIEKSASDRHAIYRKCRLEEIELPLVSGSLNDVSIEDVRDDRVCVEKS